MRIVSVERDSLYQKLNAAENYIEQLEKYKSIQKVVDTSFKTTPTTTTVPTSTQPTNQAQVEALIRQLETA